MHQRYPEFANLLLKGLQSSFTESKEDDKSNKIARYRVTLRLLGEVMAVMAVVNLMLNSIHRITIYLLFDAIIYLTLLLYIPCYISI